MVIIGLSSIVWIEDMLTLFGDINSGNVHKIQMILHRVGIPYTRVDTAQTRNEPKSPEFLRINPMGKVPAIMFENGDILSESGAILYFFGSSTELWPTDLRSQSEVLRWMFFEQYTHEPALAVLRYLKRFNDNDQRKLQIQDLKLKAHHALSVMEKRFSESEWIACNKCSIADYALYPYTLTMEESGLNPALYPAIGRWLLRVEAQPGFIKMGQDGAVDSLTFSQYLANTRK